MDNPGKICPYCAELVRAAAIKCRYCHEFFIDDLDKRTARITSAQAREAEAAARLRAPRPRPNPAPAPRVEEVPRSRESKDVPRLERVEWLIDVLGLENINQAYAMINDGRIPSNCITRMGRWLRVNPVKVHEWINGGSSGGQPVANQPDADT